MPAAGQVAEFAPAKLNLYLHVLGRRADGYHELDSLVVFPPFGDRIEATAATGRALTIDGPFAGLLEPDTDNLVLRAADALAGLAGPGRGAAMRLTKSLPVAAGLGGGSADAAATLRALQRLWQTAVPRQELLRLAASLGADVPVCLDSRPRRLGGIGDILSDVPALPDFAVVLVNPRVALSTPEVFRQATQRSRPATLPAQPFDSAAALAAFLAGCRNDLEPAAIALRPAIAEVLAALRRSKGCLLARMSGSGATCFGIFADAAGADAAAARLAHAQPDWWIEAAGMTRPR